jgi:hypothetical protein
LEYKRYFEETNNGRGKEIERERRRFKGLYNLTFHPHFTPLKNPLSDTDRRLDYHKQISNWHEAMKTSQQLDRSISLGHG